MPLFSSHVRFKRGLRGLGWATPEYFGAKGSSSVDDLAAFTTAASVLSEEGGELRLGPYLYRLDGLLTLPANVSWRGVPDATYVMWNHASANRMVFTQSNQGNPAAFRDIRFIGSAAGTGTFAVNNADARVLFERCTWNGFDSGGGPTDTLRGRIASLGSDDSEMSFVDCRMELGATNVKGLFASAGRIKMSGGRVSFPAAYAEDFAYADTSGAVELDRVHFDVTNHASGSMKILYAPSSSAKGRMSKCVLDATGAAGTILGMHWVNGTQVYAKGNQPLGSAAVLSLYGGSSAGAGSVVEGFNITNGAGGTTATIPEFCETYVFKGLSTVPTFTLPANPARYQRLRMHINNGTGSPWAAFAIGVPSIPTIPALAAGAACVADFQYTDLFVPGTFQWVMVAVSP